VKRRLSKDGKPLDSIMPDYQDLASSAKLIKESVENKETCNIKGKIHLNRVNLAINCYTLYIGNRIDAVFIQQLDDAC